MITQKKILIIGSAGSGKTTFSKKLHEILEIPLIHLDKEYWQPNWQSPDHDKWVARVDEILEKEEWILDGNYKSTLEKRIAKAELVIFLDLKRTVCVRSVLKRIKMYRGKTRDDLNSECPEKFDWEFLKWVWSFPKKYRPEILALLEKYSSVKVITLKKRKQVNKFLQELKEEKNGKKCKI